MTEVLIVVAGAVAGGLFGAIGADLWGLAKLMPRELGRRYKAWRIQRLLDDTSDDEPLLVHMLDENGEETLAPWTAESHAAHERGVQKRKEALGFDNE
jgi:hypothetical protein